ncbi:hypothetical protein [Rhizobium favelukesii]|uniref:hypothetical protein n=1 Tax=Rhizobium favelukesii TaxID=348824 RepID=UPI00215ECC29|nr:hypothetical protein [Rhizobium favelukesii]MCS0459505.1 hypothetical protein [Rhizobium favelukesii]
MSSDGHTIPEDIMRAADEVIVRAQSLITVETIEQAMSGQKMIRDVYVAEIAKAILAERELNAQPRKKIIEAMCELPHSIDGKKVEFRFDPRRPGHNALNQLITQLEVRFGTSKEEV